MWKTLETPIYRTLNDGIISLLSTRVKQVTRPISLNISAVMTHHHAEALPCTLQYSSILFRTLYHYT